MNTLMKLLHPYYFKHLVSIKFISKIAASTLLYILSILHFTGFLILTGPLLPAILDFHGGYRWLLVRRLPFSANRSPFPVLVTSLLEKKQSLREQKNLCWEVLHK